MAHRLRQFAVLGMLWCTAMPLCAETLLADPTRPPPAFGAGASENAGPASATVLQSVLIPRQGKAQAMIDGRRVRLGEMHGDSRLVVLDERGAVLEGPQGRLVLPLTPGVEKSNVVRAGGKTRPAKVSQSEVKP